MKNEENEGEQSESTSAAKVPEEFQEKVESILQNATRPMLDYLRNQTMEREKELMKSETKNEKSSTFDTEDMPS